jgi:hypothetical protein
MKTYTDEHIEYWAKVYETEGLAARGIPFETFLADPVDILHALVEVPDDTEPLLPAQAEAMARDLGAEVTTPTARRLDDTIEQITLGPPPRGRERRNQQELRQLVLAGSIMAEFLRCRGAEGGDRLADTWEQVLTRFRAVLG